MNFLLSTLLLFVTICSALPTGDKLSAQWEAFKAEFGKHYSSAEEEVHRRTVWESSLKYIEEHNAQHERGMKTYRIDGANEFADMTYEEFSENFLMPPMEKLDDYDSMPKDAIPFKNIEHAAVPASMDWRTASNVVAPIKKQDCGNCYAFASISVVESHWRLYSGRTSTVIPLSEQEITDCSKPQGNNGCHGGDPYKTYNYIKAHGRISKSSSYPNEGKDTNGCRAPSTPDSFGASIRDYVRNLNETEMKIAVGTKGPVVILMYASDAFTRLRGPGIYNGEDCPSPDVLPNHVMAVVGYGTLNGVDYWIVRNSWGPNWGDNGYVKMRRGTNTCTLARYGGVYPVI